MPFTRLEYKRDWRVDDTAENGGFLTYQDSEQQVREDLQYHPDAIKNFINALLTELESEKAAGLIGDGETGNLAETLNDLYTSIQKVRDDFVVSLIDEGILPGAMRGSLVGFEEGAWTSGTSGWTITLEQGSHGRDSATFGYQLWAKVGDEWYSDVWAVAGTRVEYQEDTGAILLTAEEPYEGKVTFFGT